MQQTVNLILPWWELINISTGILLRYLNCTWSLGKLPFLKFSDSCHLESWVQVHHFINLLISYWGGGSQTQSHFKYHSSNNYFYGSTDWRGSWPCKEHLQAEPGSGDEAAGSKPIAAGGDRSFRESRFVHRHGDAWWFQRGRLAVGKELTTLWLCLTGGICLTVRGGGGENTKQVWKEELEQFAFQLLFTLKHAVPNLMLEDVGGWTGWLRRPAETRVGPSCGCCCARGAAARKQALVFKQDNQMWARESFSLAETNEINEE